MSGHSNVAIVPYSRRAGLPRIERALDEIFFATSVTRDFHDEAARAAFRERWLGRYLVHFPDCVLLAETAAGGTVGYLAGCPDDASRLPFFADVAYYAAFAAACARYPAHLHVNVRQSERGRGVGRALVAAYCTLLATRGVGGVHAVTAAGASAVAFYRRCGFATVAEVTHDGRALVFLGRNLSA